MLACCLCMCVLLFLCFCCSNPQFCSHGSAGFHRYGGFRNLLWRQPGCSGRPATLPSHAEQQEAVGNRHPTQSCPSCKTPQSTNTNHQTSNTHSQRQQSLRHWGRSPHKGSYKRDIPVEGAGCYFWAQGNIFRAPRLPKLHTFRWSIFGAGFFLTCC